MVVRMRYETALYWERGVEKAGEACVVNEDSLLLQQVRIRHGRLLLALVSDGIGGLERGEDASGFLAEEMKEWFYEEALEIVCIYHGRRKLWRMLERSMNRRLYAAGGKLRAYGRRKGCSLGATLLALFMVNGRYLYCFAGDSRLYLAGRRGNRKLSTDDTDGQGRLLKCIGSPGWYQPEFGRGRLRREELLLLCTDGFWRLLTDADMETGRRCQGEEALTAWLKAAGAKMRKRGERDDMTVIAIKGEQECIRKGKQRVEDTG